MKHVALVALFSFVSLFRLPLALALDTASLRDCAKNPDAVLIDYETSKCFLFKNKDLFKIDLPVSGGLVSLPPDAFPNESQNCFDFTRGGRVKFDDLTAAEMKQCQDSKHRAHFAPVSKAELEKAAELILGDYFRETVEIGSSLLNKKTGDEARSQRRWAQEKIGDLREHFAACEELAGLNASARETKDDVLERLHAMSPPPPDAEGVKSSAKSLQ